MSAWNVMKLLFCIKTMRDEWCNGTKKEGEYRCTRCGQLHRA